MISPVVCSVLLQRLQRFIPELSDFAFVLEADELDAVDEDEFEAAPLEIETAWVDIVPAVELKAEPEEEVIEDEVPSDGFDEEFEDGNISESAFVNSSLVKSAALQ